MYMLPAPMAEQSSAGLWELRWYEPDRLRLDGLVESVHECLARLGELRRQWELGGDGRDRRVIELRIIEERALTRAFMDELGHAIEQVRTTTFSAGPWRAEAEELNASLDQFSDWMRSTGIPYLC
jgi:hypothetical protein